MFGFVFIVDIVWVLGWLLWLFVIYFCINDKGRYILVYDCVVFC